MVRVFIAVEPSAEIRSAIKTAGDTFRGAGRLSFVTENQMHITLKFLGEIPESSLPKITAALDSITEKPYTIKAAGISTFGRPPRVIKAEVHDNGKTALLASDIDQRLSALGIPRETKPFSPHITIARVKEHSPALTPKIAAVKEQTFGECTISEILCKKSVLTPTGPIYTTLHRVTL